MFNSGRGVAEEKVGRIQSCPKDWFCSAQVASYIGNSSGSVDFSRIPMDVKVMDISKGKLVIQRDSFKGREGLRWLRFQVTHLGEISFISNLTALRYLEITGKSFPPFDLTPLRSLIHLNHLNLSGSSSNDISSIENLKEIHTLDLSYQWSDIGTTKKMDLSKSSTSMASRPIP
jgi:hypothetical protein